MVIDILFATVQTQLFYIKKLKDYSFIKSRRSNETLPAILCHFHNLKNVKNPPIRGVLLLVKL